MNEVVELRAVVHGQVQGVGYRYWAHHTAKRYEGINGRVRNLPDGTVEVEAECMERAPLEALLAEMHTGPSAAHVDSVDAQWRTGPGKYTGFRVD